jgi:hypothetical protein
MPTDIALVLIRRAEMEAQVNKDTLIIVCLWAVVGLVLAALMSKCAFDVELAKVLVTSG